MKALSSIAAFCTSEPYDRAAHAYGKSYPDYVRAMRGDYACAPDVVAYPRTEVEISAIADQRFGGTLAGRLVLTAGLGGMGGAQPLAITLNGGVALCVEVDPARLQRRLDDRYLDERADSLDAALARCEEAKRAGRALSVGVVANAADAFPALLERGAPVDVVTDQTSAHDPLHGYVVNDLSVEAAAALR